MGAAARACKRHGDARQARQGPSGVHPAASGSWPGRLCARDLYGPAGLAAAASNALLRCLLQNTPSTDIDLERFLTSARSAVLDAADVSAEVDDEVLRFYCALARQCFINEYVFACTDEELGRVH